MSSCSNGSGSRDRIRDLQMWFNLAWFGQEFRTRDVQLVTGDTVHARRFVAQERDFTHDDVLAMVDDQLKILRAVIIGEVKEGAARFNAAMRDPNVLQVALVRFGCCPPEHADRLVQQLLARGHVVTRTGHAIRMIAFGDVPDDEPAASAAVPMRHVVQFLQAHLRTHWQVLRHAQVRDPAFGVLALIEKWGLSPHSATQGPKPPTRRGDGSLSVPRNA